MKINMSQSVRLIAFTCSTAYALAAGTSVFADELAFKAEKVLTITKAVDLVSDGEHKLVSVRAQLVLSNRETRAAREIRRKGFQIRVFNLLANETEPGVYAPLIEDCMIFWSNVIPVPGSNDFKIVIGEITEGWLVSHGSRKFEYGHYLLVFEESGSTDRIFRIRKNHVKEYFQNGMRLTVTHDSNLDFAEAEKFAKLKAKIRADLEDSTKLNRPDIPCYEYQPVRAAETEPVFASAGVLHLCSAETIPET